MLSISPFFPHGLSAFIIDDKAPRFFQRLKQGFVAGIQYRGISHPSVTVNEFGSHPTERAFFPFKVRPRPPSYGMPWAAGLSRTAFLCANYEYLTYSTWSMLARTLQGSTPISSHRSCTAVYPSNSQAGLPYPKKALPKGPPYPLRTENRFRMPRKHDKTKERKHVRFLMSFCKAFVVVRFRDGAKCLVGQWILLGRLRRLSTEEKQADLFLDPVALQEGGGVHGFTCELWVVSQGSQEGLELQVGPKRVGLPGIRDRAQCLGEF